VRLSLSRAVCLNDIARLGRYVTEEVRNCVQLQQFPLSPPHLLAFFRCLEEGREGRRDYQEQPIETLKQLNCRIWAAHVARKSAQRNRV